MATLLLFSIELIFILIFCCFLYVSLNWGARRVLQVSSLQLDETNFQGLQQNVLGIVLISGFLLLLLATGFNGWIFLQGEQPDVYTLSLIQNTPRRVWLGLAAGGGKSLCLLVLVGILQRPLRRLLDRLGRIGRAHV